ncbi:MAG: hypothetical protein U1D55_00555 [Phycisphaerae bacterium]
MPGEVAGSIRELAVLLGRSHTAVGQWVRDPRWDQLRVPPWDVGQAKAWAARTLAPNPAEAWSQATGLDDAASASSQEASAGARIVGRAPSARPNNPSQPRGAAISDRPAAGAARGGFSPADAGSLDALRRNPLAAAKLKLTVVRAQKLELERAILAGEFVPRRDVEQLFASCAYRVRAAMEALPRHLAGRLAALNNATAIEAVLDDAIRAALLELSRGPELSPPPETEGGESNPT